MTAERPIRVAVLGSAGSIGSQAVDVLGRLPGEFQVTALATAHRGAILEHQAAALRPAAVSLGDDAELHRLDLPAGTERVGGAHALEALATRDDVDIVVVGTSGLVSLRPVLAALRAGKVVATANKETLVAGGHLVMPLARERAAAIGATRPWDPMADSLGWLRPIDSEHSAIWQCLAGESRAEIAGLVLTASGGPFRDVPADELVRVTPAQALHHPVWHMGPKISVDSATLVNKGLEVIEAHWLYDVPLDTISVVVHPQSVVHSAVLFRDGSLKAQIGTPDMRLPIQYALTYPRRVPSPAPAPDLIAAARLDFRAPDEQRFPALRIARAAGLAGPRASLALVAADEVAVARFLAGSLDFAGIPRLLEAAVAQFGESSADATPAGPSLDELVALEAEVRAFAERAA